MLRNYELSWDAYPKAAPMSDYPSVDYLCIHVLAAPAEVWFIDDYQHGQEEPLPPLSSIEYSYNKSEWLPCSSTHIPVLDHVYLRGSPTVPAGEPGEGNPTWSYLGSLRTIAVNMPFYVSGKISSLVDKNLTGTIGKPQYGFQQLFSNNISKDNIIDAQYLLLDYTDLSGTIMHVDNYGMYTGMFLNCANLLHAPALPATKVGEGTYWAMFNSCSKLTAAPDLMATEVDSNSYTTMFMGCSSLTTPAKMPSSVAVKNAQTSKEIFNGMYGYCPLNYTPRLPLITGHQEHPNGDDYPANEIFKYNNRIVISTTQSQETPYLFRIPASGTQTAYSKTVKVKDGVNLAVNTDYYCNIPMLQ